MAKTKNSKAPNKVQLAEMKVRESLGESHHAIGLKMGFSNHTIKKYLQSDIYNDPDILELVEALRAKEVNDLQIIISKARQCQHKYLDAVLNGEKEVNPIAVTAIADRNFTQLRLIECQSTEIVDVRAEIAKLTSLEDRLVAELERRKKLKEAKIIDVTPGVPTEKKETR